MTHQEPDSTHAGVNILGAIALSGALSLTLAISNALFQEAQVTASLQQNAGNTLSIVSSMDVASANVQIKTAPKKDAPILQSIYISGLPSSLAVWHTPTVKAIGKYSDGTRKEVKVRWSLSYKYNKKEVKDVEGCEDSSTCILRFENEHKVTIFASHEYTNADKTEYLAMLDGGLKPTPVYKDDIPEWADDYIKTAGRAGIMSGYEDGTFGPGDPVTNAQFATMFYRTLRAVDVISNKKNCPGNLPEDMTKDHFAYRAFCYYMSQAWSVKWALDMNEPMSRREAAIMMNEGFGDALQKVIYGDLEIGKHDLKIPDVKESDTDLMRALQVTVHYDIMGKRETAFNPDKTLNRAEAAAVVTRALNFLIHLN